MNYRLNQQKKLFISQNLIDFMKSKESLLPDSATFISNWILTNATEKNQTYYDIWELVLKNYMPSTRPVLYRSCKRRDNGKIASFTGRVSCAQKFSDGKGFLLICDTKEMLQFSEFEKRGDFRHSFFPLSELLKKESKSEDCKFSRQLINDYIKEDEYIMRVNLGCMYSCKWYQDK